MIKLSEKIKSGIAKDAPIFGNPGPGKNLEDVPIVVLSFGINLEDTIMLKKRRKKHMKIIRRYLNYRKNVDKYSTPFTGFLTGFTFIFLFCAIACCALASQENDMVYLLLVFLLVGISLSTMFVFQREIKKKIKSGDKL
jgi:hypothetical protein